MRYIVTVAALILSCGITTSYALDDPGTHSCGRYLAAIHGHAPGIGTGLKDHGKQFYDDHILYMYWLAGFLSATNSWVMEPPNGIKTDSAAVDVWIKKWCEQNPTKPLIEAAMAFVFDQRKDYLKVWFARQAR
jgi:hypothetical protein